MDCYKCIDHSGSGMAVLPVLLWHGIIAGYWGILPETLYPKPEKETAADAFVSVQGWGIGCAERITCGIFGRKFLAGGRKGVAETIWGTGTDDTGMASDECADQNE